MKRAAHSTFRRCTAGLLALLMTFGPVATPVYAALTPLANQPLNITTTAKPNIVLTVDDSTSMLFDFLPDYVATGQFCRGGTGRASAACGIAGAASDFTLVGGGKYNSPGYIFQQYNYPFTGFGMAGTFDPSGPGAGCFPGSPPTCSAGIDPGALPGRNTYPTGPDPSWPNSRKPFEYWLFWPAPVHNSAMNAMYYDPLLTYEPPSDYAGKSYPQMNAANTTNWTKVPADPWATTVVYVPLTANVNLGMWCNSDWSVGVTGNTDYCRVNGSGAAAFSSVPAADGTDYTYPWAPADASLGETQIATYARANDIRDTFAAQKVTLGGSGFTGTATTAMWGKSQDPKYFYENENILWCDVTSAAWPQIGPTVTQTCSNPVAQTCNATDNSCQNIVATACNGYSLGVCNGLVTGTCNGWKASKCTGTAASCSGTSGASCQFGTCSGMAGQTCNGTIQTCPTSAQTCSGPFNQTCKLPGTQTCTQPVCTTTYTPPGCNLLPPDPENPCTPVTTCTQPVCTPDPGKCSIQTSLTCTKDADCVQQPGTCNLTGGSCMKAADCPAAGKCNSTKAVCQTAGDCPIVNGKCSVQTTVSCTSDSQCPSTGKCSNNASKVCTAGTDCGQCVNPAGQACTANGNCTAVSGTCTQATCPDGTTVCSSTLQCSGQACTAKSCTANSQCVIKGGICQSGGAACGANSNCPTTPGVCSTSAGQPWSGIACDGTTQANANLVCLTKGTCNNSPFAQCTSNGACPTVNGKCSLDNTVSCTSTANCNYGTCKKSGAVCNTTTKLCAAMPGTCSGTGAACTTPGSDPTNCPNVGKCSITGTQCTSNAQCPNQPGPLDPAGATCSTGGVSGVALTTLRKDAETNGLACRRNNQTAGANAWGTAAYNSNRYTYPSGKFITPVSFGSGNDACTMTDHWKPVPRHYWKVSVEWCDTKIQSYGDKWNGYGTTQNSGTCQSFRDSTHVYPRFYQYGATAGTDNVSTAAFQRVDLDISKRSTATYDHGVDALGNAVVRTFDEEMTNYANWFAYYRTRIQAVKSVTSLTFKELDNTFRVGLHTLSNGAANSFGADPSKFVDIQDFDTTQKTTWFGELFNITIPLQQETPNLDAMTRIGDWFLNGTNGALVGATDPIVLSCQKNWHMLFTDGFTNQTALPKTVVGNQDDKVPAVIPVGQSLPGITVPGLTPGSVWPAPYREDPNAGASNAASDYAMNYWIRDLRTSGKTGTDNVPTSLVDPASWQHLNFAALSLGTQGKLPAGNQSVTESQLAGGSLQWPQPIPNVYRPDNSGVDDLWHAAINGRGRFVNAESADELKLGMGQILQDITNNAGARAGAGFQSSNVSSANNYIYRARFEPGWGGSVTKIQINPKTGAEGTIAWEASTQLSTQLQITAQTPTPWITARNLVTMDDKGKAVPFLWDSLSATQQDALSPNKPARGKKVLSFLRGDASNEGSKLGQLRVRSKGVAGENFLGDIVNSQSIYIGAPSAAYLDAFDPGYTTFASKYKSRSPTVYVGANDGMLHVFDDASGNERWAYIPHDLYRVPTQAGLGALAYQDGALPPFRHHYYVDSTPRVVDVDFDAPNGTDWRSLLVGGLGKGGMSYYALDVTSPDAVSDEATAASQVLWEFTDSDLGYTYGRPIITKTHAFGGAWVVIVPSGYNNATGEGKIFIVDAKSGTLLKTMGTGSGTAASPSGLAQIAGYTRDYRNQLVEQVYGGDLYGHFWRFDLSDADHTKWSVVELATLTDASGAGQPVTTPPQIEVDLANGIDRWVFVGTGRLLDNTDLTDTTIANQTQTMYAIRDGTALAPLPFKATINPRTDKPPFDAIVDKVNGLSSKPDTGWYDDLPTGQRIVTPIQATVSILGYIGTSPQDDPCLTGQPATLYVRQFPLGNSLLLNSSGSPVASIFSAEGGVGMEIVNFEENAASPTEPDLRVAITLGTSGDVRFVKIRLPSILTAHRMSWRLLGQ